MRLIIPDIDKYFDFDNQVVNRLVIESPFLWRKVLQSFRNQFERGFEYARAYDGTTELNFTANAEIIYSPIDINANRSRLLTKLYKALTVDGISGEQLEKTYSLKRDIRNYFEQFLCDYDFDLVYNDDFDMTSLFKVIGIRFNEASNDVLNNLLEYMLCVQTFDGDKVFILIGLSDYMSSTEKEKFHETVLAKEVKLFLLDRALYERSRLEKIVVIDDDLCEI
ncbi:MAG: type II-A CRISPR-associated protein Csn2 [Oscillospiraceae bacterium]|nr:type II-A CRISPR-associated protein Csn2 [Oscillospiraceae bacterium]